MSLIQNIFAHNWWATLLINFKLLPIRQAVKFPIVVYHRFRLTNTKGRIILQTPNVHRGMIRLGSQGSEMFPISNETILYLQGDMVCHGTLVVGVGSCIRVGEGATLDLGDGAILGAQNMIFCEKRVTLCDEFLSAWQCQIMDTDRHGLTDLQTGVKEPFKKEVYVGKHTWIGNSVVINKGTYLPDNSIIASGSMCNKDFSDEESYCLFAGRPAKVVRRNKKWEV